MGFKYKDSKSITAGWTITLSKAGYVIHHQPETFIPDLEATAASKWQFTVRLYLERNRCAGAPVKAVVQESGETKRKASPIKTQASCLHAPPNDFQLTN